MSFAPFCRRFYRRQALPRLQSGNRQRCIAAGPRTVITRSDNSQRRYLCPPLMPVMNPLNRGITSPRLRCRPPRRLTSLLLPPSPCPGLPRRASGPPQRTPGSLNRARRLPRCSRISPRRASVSLRRTSGSSRHTSGSPNRARGLPHPLPRSLHRLPRRGILHPISAGLLTSAPIRLHYLTSFPLYRIFSSTGLQSRFRPGPLSRPGPRNPISIRHPSTPLFLSHTPRRISSHTHPPLHNPSHIPQQRLAHRQPDTNPSHHSSRRQPTKVAEPGAGALHPGDRHTLIKHRPHERPCLLRRRYSYRAVLRRKK